MEQISSLEKINVNTPNISEIQDILSVQKPLLERRDNRAGFLVNAVTEEDLDFAIKNNQRESFILVARNKDGKIIGYILSYDMSYFLKEHSSWFEEVNLDPKLLENKKVLYGKHVASNGTINGIGKSLNKSLFELAKQKGYSFFLAEICEGPVKNDKSITFNTEKFSLEKVSQYTDDKGFTWGIYLKSI